MLAGRTISSWCVLLLAPCFFARAAQAATPAPPTRAEVDFERHVVGLFGRMGCNAGSCHGSFQGRGGFRLSLFGSDADRDFVALTREVLGRRISREDPDQSLLLLKATGQVAHGGGRRFGKDSWQYRLLRDWIRSGARRVQGRGDVTAVRVVPEEAFLPASEAKAVLTVRADFADGSEEDVSRFSEFRTNNDSVAAVDAGGTVTAVQPGDTSVIVSYRGNVVAVRVLVPGPTPDPRFTAGEPQRQENYIDREVFAKLRRLNILPSELSGDAEFLRRITIDTIGSLPSPDEVRAFLADRDPEKRLKKIDALLANPLHAALWATKFCDITGNNTDLIDSSRDLQAKRSQMWHEWFRKRIAENRPYDEIVHGVLCATSREGLPPEEWLRREKELEEVARKGFATSYADRASLDLFWRPRGNVPLEQWGEKTAAAFLGTRLECAQCHKHPFDRWSQADYRAFANVFGQVAVGQSPEAKKLIDTENTERRKSGKNQNQVSIIREVYLALKPRSLGQPERKVTLPARALGGPAIPVEKGRDAREALFAWMHAPGNPFFARSFINRVWAHYTGVGLVEPVDNFAVGNPPSNERLLDALAQDFTKHGFDMRRLERTILTSRVYQLTSAANPTNRLDRRNYSHAAVRSLMAEVVLDVCNAALGVREKFGPDAPPGCRAIEIGASRLQNGNLMYAFNVFGRPPRTSACDCQRETGPALPQTLYRMTDAGLLAKVRGGRLAELLRSKKTDAEVLDELFLATLTRLPTDAEREAFTAYRAGTRDRRAAFTDTLWALVNTREFILNH
jgi:hypothetical protein